MLISARRVALVLATAACVSGPLFSQSAKNWCLVKNHSSVAYSVAISDTVAKSGVFFFKPQGATGPGTKLDKKGDSFALEAGKTYEFNYDTTAGTMAATLKFRDPAGKYTEVNFKFLEVAGRRSDVRVGLTSDDWANSSLDFHLSGCFVQGKTFIAMD